MAKVPLRGLAIANLQCAMMTFTGFGLSRPSRVVWVPFISAGLKALPPGCDPCWPSPRRARSTGRRLRSPAGTSSASRWGGALVGAWAALQGFALQYLVLGGGMVKAYDAVFLWLAGPWHLSAPGLPWLVGAWALLHALVAGSVALAAGRLRARPKRLRDLIERESGRASAATGDAAWRPPRRRHTLRDLGRWQFWLPLLVVGGVMLTTGRPLESVAWLVLRFLAVSVVLLALVSLVRPPRWAEGLRRRGFWGPALPWRTRSTGARATRGAPGRGRRSAEAPAKAVRRVR